MLDDKQLLEWNKRGWIPGPKEDEKEFKARVEKLMQGPSMVFDFPLSLDDWKESHQKTQKLFDFSIDWMGAFYSNKQLPFWQGAAFWMAADVPLIQLRLAFRKGKYTKLYSRTEVLAHEAVHAARMAFTEPRFEEMIAYSSSKSLFRQWFGSFFRYSWESYIFIGCLLISIGVQALELWVGSTKWLTALIILPWVTSPYGCARLFYNKYLFSRCKKRIKKTLLDPSKALAVMMRLTDKEIAIFSSMSSEKISAYAKNDPSLRWRLLRAAYFL